MIISLQEYSRFLLVNFHLNFLILQVMIRQCLIPKKIFIKFYY